MATEETTLGPKGRTYGDACGAAQGLDLVGERWTLLLVRELLLGPKRFTDLRKGLPGISTNILADRLEMLETAGVARRRTLPPPAASKVYELTEWGRSSDRWSKPSAAGASAPRGGAGRTRSAWTGSWCRSGRCSIPRSPGTWRPATR